MSIKHIKKQIFLFLLFVIFCTGCIKNEKPGIRHLRMGYMPNVTHAPVLYGIEKKIFNEFLGESIDFKPVHFVVGNNIVDAFVTKQIDVAYIGPGPFINAAYRKIPIKLLANSTNGGTLIVSADNIVSLSESVKISVPQFGNTQDLILRKYLEKYNLQNKVNIISIPPQDTGSAFFTMSIDAACLPEPWGTILIEKKVCMLIVDEKNVLNNGNYPVTLLVANKDYAEKNPDLILKILKANKKSIELINNNQNEAVAVVTKAIANITKKDIDINIIRKSFQKCTFSDVVNLNVMKDFEAAGERTGYYKKGFGGNENHFN